MQQMQYAIIHTSHNKMGMSPDCYCVRLGRTTGFIFRTKDDVLLFTLLKNYQNQKLSSIILNVVQRQYHQQIKAIIIYIFCVFKY